MFWSFEVTVFSFPEKKISRGKISFQLTFDYLTEISYRTLNVQIIAKPLGKDR